MVDTLSIVPAFPFLCYRMIIMRDIHGVPAYGRDYKSMAAVKADWAAKKDFRDALSGQYFNIDSGIKAEIWIRYAKLTKLMRVQ